MSKADLHIHSTASDGKMLPEEIVEIADELNLSIISITDHDTINGFSAAQEAAKKMDVEILPGVEITTSFRGREVHLLGYNFDTKNRPFNDLLSRHRKARVKRAGWIINRLQKKGLELDINEVVAEARGQIVGRPHIAEILRKKGYIATVKEAFIRYLSDDVLGPIENNYENLEQVISIVKRAGGVTVLAHPGRLYTEDELIEFVNAGIDGMEVIHPGHSFEMQKFLESFAQNNNLIATGGSDYHGSKKSYYRHFGVLTTSLEQVNKIKALTRHRREISA